MSISDLQRRLRETARRLKSRALGGRHIHLDRPTNLGAIAHWEVFEGWAVTRDASDGLCVRLDGRPVTHHDVDRGDVQAAFPELIARGFIFFLEATTDRAVLDIGIGPFVRSFDLAMVPDARRAGVEAQGALDRHRDFLATVLVCPSCRRPLPSLLGSWRCECGEPLDLTAGLDLIPHAYPDRSSIRFNGAICSHAYDQSAEALVRDVAAMGGMVLDCGAGWRSSVRANVITTEIVRYPSTDVVAVSEQLPFRDAAFDGVLSLHVLEHVRNPFVCAAELMRVLKPGGKFLVVTPYIVQVHGFPYHFFNPTADGLRALFAGFATDCEISVPPIAHPVIALRELIAAFAPHLEPEALAALHEMTVGELSESDPRTLLESVLVRRFKPSGLQRLAANFALTGVRTSTGRPTPGAPC